mgnify:CR=1 FL=1
MFLPHAHRVLVEVDEVHKKSGGGIIFTEEQTTREQQAQILGTVLAVGPDAAVDEQIKEGTRVGIAKWGGMTPPGEEHKRLRIVNDTDICMFEVATNE